MVIFHCEFSSHRGPRLCRFLRNWDRKEHIDVYPKLLLPQLYIMRGGYKEFWNTNPDQCDPRAYLPMTDKGHKAECASGLATVARPKGVCLSVGLGRGGGEEGRRRSRESIAQCNSAFASRSLG